MNIEVILTEDQITELIQEHLHTLDVDELLKHVSLQDAVDHVQTFDNGISTFIEDVETYAELHEEDISKFLTFENSNKVARSLYFKDAETARAYYEELGFWLTHREPTRAMI